MSASQFEKPESEVFAKIAIEKGVPVDKIIQESQSTNTGDNIVFVKNILKERGLNLL